MQAIPGKFALASDVALQTRRAQAVDAQLAGAIRRTCEGIPQLAACYLLDARKPETAETALLIAVTLDDEAAHMDLVAQQFQAMLRQFPTHASKTFIMSSAQFVHNYAGAEFYVKQAA
jgi:hypothetical protein